APAPSPDAAPPPAGEASSACSVAASVAAIGALGPATSVPCPLTPLTPLGSGPPTPAAASAAGPGVAAPAGWATPPMFHAATGSMLVASRSAVPEPTWNAVGNWRSSRFARITAGLYSVLTTAL